MTFELSRRDLLKAAGTLVVGFAFDSALPAFARAADAAKSVDPKQVDSFLAIHQDGRVTVYTSKVDGRTRELSRAVAAIHMFNHGTHHRGQLTTLLKQAGRDPGVTDLPWLPGVVRTREGTPRHDAN